MYLSIPVIVLCVIAFGIAFVLSWKTLGVYFNGEIEISPSPRILNLDKVSRITGEKEFGYLDYHGVFHSHFYQAELTLTDGKHLPVVFFRYIPDAFGKPIRDRIGKKEIEWWREPDALIFHLSSTRCMILKMNKTGKRPSNAEPV